MSTKSTDLIEKSVDEKMSIEKSIDEIVDFISEQTALIYVDLFPEEDDVEDIDDVRINEIGRKLTEALLVKLNKMKNK